MVVHVFPLASVNPAPCLVYFPMFGPRPATSRIDPQTAHRSSRSSKIRRWVPSSLGHGLWPKWAGHPGPKWTMKPTAGAESKPNLEKVGNLLTNRGLLFCRKVANESNDSYALSPNIAAHRCRFQHHKGCLPKAVSAPSHVFGAR